MFVQYIIFEAMIIRGAKDGWINAATLLLFPILAYWQVATMGYTLKWDAMDQFFQHLFFVCECYGHGQLPLWNPYQHLGQPFFADPLAGFWYPVNSVLAALLPCDARLVNASLIVHIIIGGFAMYSLLRGLGISGYVALCFALAYECNGMFVSNAQHLPYIVSAAWLPFVLDAFLRLLHRPSAYHSLFLGGVTTMLITGGYPAFTLILASFLVLLWVITGVKSLISKDYSALGLLVGYSFLGLLVCLVLSAGFLYSFWEVYPLSVRADAISLTQIHFGPFPPGALVSTVLPYVVSADVDAFGSNISMINAYMGLLAVVFLIPGLVYGKLPKKSFWVFMAIVALLASFGEVLPVRQWMAEWLPGFNKFRFPSTFRIFWMIAFMALAASGLQYVVNQLEVKQKALLPQRLILLFGVVLLVFVLFSVGLGAKLSYPPLFNMRKAPEYLAAVRFHDLMLSQGVIVLALLALLYGLFRLPWQRTAKLLLVAWVVVELLLSAQFNIPATVISNRKMHRYLTEMAKLPQGFPMPGEKTIGSKLGDDRIALWPTYYNHNTLYKQVGFGGFNPFELKTKDRFNSGPCKEVVWQNPVAFIETGTGAIAWQGWQPYGARLAVDMATDGKLVLSQVNYKGWQAKLNGHTVPITPYCETLVGIEIPKGKHLVSFTFERPLVAGLFGFCLVGYAIWLVAIVFIARRGAAQH